MKYNVIHVFMLWHASAKTCIFYYGWCIFTNYLNDEKRQQQQIHTSLFSPLNIFTGIKTIRRESSCFIIYYFASSCYTKHKRFSTCRYNILLIAYKLYGMLNSLGTPLIIGYFFAIFVVRYSIKWSKKDSNINCSNVRSLFNFLLSTDFSIPLSSQIMNRGILYLYVCLFVSELVQPNDIQKMQTFWWYQYKTERFFCGSK